MTGRSPVAQNRKFQHSDSTKYIRQSSRTSILQVPKYHLFISFRSSATIYLTVLFAHRGFCATMIEADELSSYTRQAFRNEDAAVAKGMSCFQE